MGHKLNIQLRHYWQSFRWLIGALFISTGAWADNKDQNDIPWYQIEVIIFANQNYLGIASETWPEDQPLNMNNVIDLQRHEDAVMNQATATRTGQTGAPAANTPIAYEFLDASQLQLTPVEKKLQSSNKYVPLIHIAWRQPTVSPEQARPVFVYYGMGQANQGYNTAATGQSSQLVIRDQGQSGGRFSSVPMNSSFAVDNSHYGELMSATEADTHVGPQPSTLFGTLRLSVSRYLHLEADLDYRIPVLKEEVVPVDYDETTGETSGSQFGMFNSPDQKVETKVIKRQVLQNFNLKETRRMRSKEIHYFDNPVIGVVVRVIPYEIPKVEPAFDPASQAFKTGTKPSAPTSTTTTPVKKPSR